MSFKPLITLPSYNTGAELLLNTLADVLAQPLDLPVMVIIDGSTDDSATAAMQLAQTDPRLRVILKPHNSGKGDTLRHAAQLAQSEGFTHIITVDADGQHPGSSIADLVQAAMAHPTSLIMGAPQFGADVPKARLYGRRLTIFWTDLETLFCGLGDTLFGMRVYPVEPFLRAFAQTPFARGFDFDPEIAVRMAWLGCCPIQVPVPVRYLQASEGGVSHFNYLRDNIKLTLLHFRLVPEFILLRALPFIRHLRSCSKGS